MTKHQAVGKTVHTALDDLDYGPQESQDSYGKVKRTKLPEGVTYRRLFRDITMITWPSFIELVLTQLVGMADQIMVGRMPGEAGVQGLSAVGLATLPNFLMLTMIIALNVGTTAVVARSRGQQNQEKANDCFRQAMVLNLIISAVLMVVGLFICRPLILLMGGSGISQATLDQGVTYLRIQMYGFIPVCLCSTITAALRGVGDTKTPMIYNTVANIVNVIFNYFLIYGAFGFPTMGVAGASLATVIGRIVAFFMAMLVAFGKKHYLYLDFKKRFRFDKGVIQNIVSIGLPSMIEQLIIVVLVVQHPNDIEHRKPPFGFFLIPNSSHFAVIIKSNGYFGHTVTPIVFCKLNLKCCPLYLSTPSIHLPIFLNKNSLQYLHLRMSCQKTSLTCPLLS